MRSSFFWIVSFFLLFLFSSTISIFFVLNITDLNVFQTDKIVISVLIFFIFSFLFSLLISSRFIKPLKNIAGEINDFSKMEEIYYSSKFVPLEVKEIIIAIQKNQNRIKDSESEIATEKKLLSTILSMANDGIIITDKRGKISMINESAIRVFSLSQEKLIGTSLTETLRNHKVNELWEKCKRSKRQQQTFFETAPQKSFIHCVAAPLDPEMPGSMLFIFQDLTRMRQLEIVRRDFVSNVSHELRTPLTSLKLITETLGSGALENPSVAKTFLKRMDGEVDNLTQIVEELLELSRIESGQAPLEKEWTNPFELIKKNCDRMKMQAERAGLTITYQCDKTIPNILVDPHRLGRVLVNLIHNAIKFTPPGGKIEVSGYVEKENLIFSVSDTGVGIPPKDLKRIFERFYKTDASRSNHGTGLGLSISKHIIESHGGKIWAESIPTQGSKILFTIPLSK